jgi:hypothetical protein
LPSSGDPRAYCSRRAIELSGREKFIAVIVTDIYITDPSNKSHGRLRRDYLSFKTLEPDLDQSFTFFHSSVSIYYLVERFCRENPAFTKDLAQVKASFNPIAAFYLGPDTGMDLSEFRSVQIAGCSRP